MFYRRVVSLFQRSHHFTKTETFYFELNILFCYGTIKFLLTGEITRTNGVLQNMCQVGRGKILWIMSNINQSNKFILTQSFILFTKDFLNLKDWAYCPTPVTPSSRIWETIDLHFYSPNFLHLCDTFFEEQVGFSKCGRIISRPCSQFYQWIINKPYR